MAILLIGNRHYDAYYNREFCLLFKIDHSSYFSVELMTQAVKMKMKM